MCACVVGVHVHIDEAKRLLYGGCTTHITHSLDTYHSPTPTLSRHDTHPHTHTHATYHSLTPNAFNTYHSPTPDILMARYTSTHIHTRTHTHTHHITHSPPTRSTLITHSCKHAQVHAAVDDHCTSGHTGCGCVSCHERVWVSE